MKSLQLEAQVRQLAYTNLLEASLKAIPFNFVVPVFVVWLLLDDSNQLSLFTWMGFMTVLTLVRYRYSSQQLQELKDNKNTDVSEISFRIGILISGLSWGLGFIYLTPHLDTTGNLIYLWIVAGIMAGGYSSMLPSRVCFAIFALAAFLSPSLYMLYHHEIYNFKIPLTAILYTAMLLNMHRKAAGLIQRHFCSVIENKQLLEELSNTQKQLEEAAHKDVLTGLYNRRYAESMIQNEMERSNRYNTNTSLLLFDLDDFKKINDTYGHPSGDDVLKQFASLASERSRQVDTVARWGGEEFIVLCPETDVQGAELLAESIRKALQSFGFASMGKVTASCGVANLKAQETKDTWLKRVDKALYEAKRLGKNRTYIAGT